MTSFMPPVMLDREVAIDNSENVEWTLKYFAGSPRDWIVMDKIITDKYATSTEAMELIAQQIHEARHNEPV